MPPGFPAPRVPASNPMSEEKRELGRRLFYDPRLSGNATQSCASCHQPAKAFTDGRAHALGSTGETHPRSAMSLANVAFAASLTWADPGKRSLESQARVPMENEHPVEMGTKGRESEILARLSAEPVYRDLFARAFPGDRPPISLANARRAIACFERTILSGDSPYDRYVWRDDRSGMSEAAMRGMALFFSDRTRCSRCHAGFTFGGPAVWQGGAAAKPAFASNGLPLAAADGDGGLAKVTGRRADRGRFRVPTLRNVAITAPYMHDGRFATLAEVIEHYARGSDPSNRTPLVPGFAATEEEKRDLIAFLESLTDEASLASAELANPWQRR
ncbi:MAG TPA: MbnH family di-heme enzyme [Thermoanaerobaculia bacterium]